MPLKYWSVVFMLSFVFAIGANLWFDSGCTHQALITTHPITRTCIN